MSLKWDSPCTSSSRKPSGIHSARGSQFFSCKVPDSKYFWPHSVSHIWSSSTYFLLSYPFKNVQNILSSEAERGLWPIVCQRQGQGVGPCSITHSSLPIVLKRANLWIVGEEALPLQVWPKHWRVTFSKYTAISTLQFCFPAGKTRSAVETGYITIRITVHVLNRPLATLAFRSVTPSWEISVYNAFLSCQNSFKEDLAL